MYLKELTISGFKSFAKKTVLSFSTSITAIVGPNGSGKSNVAEAFRFALGEQSIKTLRGKKGEDLIFNGSRIEPRANRASVKLTFNNQSRLLNLDFDEVTFERIVHRDGINEYFINGSSVRLRDIGELLAGAHIGASGHHIISQGEADRILNANNKERREMIEDALGLKIYQYKRKESERKLSKTEENIESIASLRREIAPHIKYLKKQVDKIHKAEELRKTLSDLLKEYLVREQAFISHEEESIKNEEGPLKESLDRIEGQVNAIREKINHGERNSLEKARSEKISEINDALSLLAREKNEAERELGKIEGMFQVYEKGESKSHMGSVPQKQVEKFNKDIGEQIQEALTEEDVSIIKKILLRVSEVIRDFHGMYLTDNPQSAQLKHEEEKKGLLEKKSEVENKLLSIKEKEGHLEKERQEIETLIKNQGSGVEEIEQGLLQTLEARNELMLKQARLNQRKETLVRLKTSFEEEEREGAILIGRAVFSYEQTPTPEGALDEAREKQEIRRKEIERIKIKLEDLGTGGIDETLKEYQNATERDAFFEKEITDLTQARETLEKIIKDLEEELDREFKQGILKINTEFQKFFTLMFGGGNAGIRVEATEKRVKKSAGLLQDLEEKSGNSFDEEPEQEQGIEVNVSLPHKKTKGLMMLSGGERALTSIALLFAISQVNPPPFIILDETDAALDEANSKKYGDMVENLSKDSQLILITHNRETMSRAGVLYGVTMGSDGTSRLLSVKFDEAVQVAK